MEDELWLRAAAMTDDDMAAVELLLCLKQSAVSPPRPPDHKPTTTSSVSPLPPLAWGVRQPRSKAAVASVSGKKERREPTSRRSPTTPLSWSGGGGGSGVAGGDASPPSGDDGGYDDEEESSPRRPDRCVPAAIRSKGANDSSTTPSTSKKSRRRKKTFAELKEEESSLLRIRTDLKKALASMRSRFKEQQLLNESLKRRKIELQLKPVKSTQLEPDSMVRHANNGCEVESSSCCSDLDASSNILKQVKQQQSVTHSCDSRSVQNVSFSCQEPAFVLPDLNMIPDYNEEDSS